MTTSRTHIAVTITLVLAASGCAGRVGLIGLKQESDKAPCLVKKPKIVVDTQKSDPKFLGLAWVVHNTCDRERTITIADFKQEGNAVPPPVDCPGTLEVKVPSGSISVISCVAKDKTEGKYTYVVKLDGVAVDPDLIIKRK